jgi:phosphoglycerate-specific signal transduction histidine kinase
MQPRSVCFNISIGLGLSIGLHIIEKLSGEVSAASEMEHGSLFFTLLTDLACLT